MAVVGIELFNLDEPVVMGHQFCADVVEYGPGTRGTLVPGTRVTSVPVLLRPAMVMIGYAGIETPGAYSEYMVLSGSG
jgi:threonine dehydrogenase-like Zn-dependent dehydrogenase